MAAENRFRHSEIIIKDQIAHDEGFLFHTDYKMVIVVVFLFMDLSQADNDTSMDGLY